MAWFYRDDYDLSIRLVPFKLWLHFTTYPVWGSAGRNDDGTLKIYFKGRAFRFGWTYNTGPVDYGNCASSVLGE